MKPLDTSDQSYIIECVLELADVLSSSEYININDNIKECSAYMSHTLVNYILNNQCSSRWKIIFML